VKGGQLAEQMEYPEPKVPAHPVLSWGTLGGAFTRRPGVLDVGDRLDVMSGRMALAHALKHMGAGPGTKILLPAYHCTAMVEPVVWCGATPAFYRTHADLTADLDDLACKVDASTRALIVIHYFGFPQDLGALRAFSDAHDLRLIEDCAHAFFGEVSGRPLGSVGDYAIASWWKFFPMLEGGCLTSHRFPVGRIPLQGVGFGFEARSLVNSLEHAGHRGRLRPLSWLLAGLFRLKDMVNAWRKRRQRPDPEQRTLVPTGSPVFDAHWIDRRPSLFSRFVARAAGHGRIVRRRRANYLRLQQALRDQPGCTLVFPELPAGVVPYVFPLLVDEPERVFPFLKRRGVPIIRFGEFLWSGVDDTTCSVAADYSRRLFQFPCHQELQDSELAWILDEVRSVLSQPAVEQPA
jgi:dTDP-4-amino-4,6-dideoxygalactose transaminase